MADADAFGLAMTEGATGATGPDRNRFICSSSLARPSHGGSAVRFWLSPPRPHSSLGWDAHRPSPPLSATQEM